MSFLNQISNLSETIDIPRANGYSYDSFMEDMLLIETAVNTISNSYIRVYNETNIENLLENNSLIEKKDDDSNKVSVIEKLKILWKEIVDKFFKFIDNIYNSLYEQIVLHKSFIEKHKDEIMKTDLIYKNKLTTISVEGKNMYGKVPIAYHDVRLYKNFLNPNFITPLLTSKSLEKFMGENNRIDKTKLFDFYMNEILGSSEKDTNIDIDKINAKKEDLIKSLGDVYKNVIKYRKTIIDFNKKEPPTDITPEDLKKFQNTILAETQSIQVYNKVLILYCKEVSKLLRSYIKSSKLDSKEGE